MSPRGKPPSLISGQAGASKIVVARGKRTCKWCKSEIAKNAKCVEVAIPRSFGSKTYCPNCFVEILSQSKRDIANLERDLMMAQ
jgi:hypothetical protein